MFTIQKNIEITQNRIDQLEERRELFPHRFTARDEAEVVSLSIKIAELTSKGGDQ